MRVLHKYRYTIAIVAFFMTLGYMKGVFIYIDYAKKALFTTQNLEPIKTVSKTIPVPPAINRRIITARKSKTSQSLHGTNADLRTFLSCDNELSEVFQGFEVDQMPFMGNCEGLPETERRTCFEEAYRAYLKENLNFPQIALDHDNGGTVVVQFIVTKKGHLINFKIVRDIGAGCGEEAVRVFRTMPAWSPAIKHGQPVNVRFTAPVKFELQ